MTYQFNSMFMIYLISQHVYDLPTPHSTLNGLSRCVGMRCWYIMLPHCETEVYNSRRRYAVFTYGKVQLSLSLTRHDVMKTAPRLLSSLLDSHPLSVPRPHGTNRTEPQGWYGSFADQKNHMDEHLKTRIVRDNVLLCFLSQPVHVIKRNAFFVTRLFVVSFFCNPPSLCAHVMVTTCGNITASTAGNDELVATGEHDWVGWDE
jgi:hypothetical protein